MNNYKTIAYLGGVALIALIIVGWNYTEAIRERNQIERTRIMMEERARQTEVPERRQEIVEASSSSSTNAQPAIQLAPSKKKDETTTPTRISLQIKAFDDYLENNLVGTQVDCIVFATYNNVVSDGQMDDQTFKQAFPESREFYESKCRSSYLGVVTNERILIAEPELQPLRTLLTSYAEEVKAFSRYALGSGFQGLHIDEADKKMDNLRTLSREEVLKLKRKYTLL